MLTLRPKDWRLARIDEAITLASDTGQHWTDAFLHRLRGRILLKCDAANTAPAEQAFLTAIAVAQQQQAKSFELRAALSLAKLYQSTGRPADAHAVLGPALKGFSPTPEFPEIAEAQALLATLLSDCHYGGGASLQSLADELGRFAHQCAGQRGTTVSNDSSKNAARGVIG